MGITLPFPDNLLPAAEVAMNRRLVHGLLVAILLLPGCQHGVWQHVNLVRPVGRNADKLARWVDRHPLRWIEHHPMVVEVPVTALVLTAAAVALYMEAKHGNLDFDFSE